MFSLWVRLILRVHPKKLTGEGGWNYIKVVDHVRTFKQKFFGYTNSESESLNWVSEFTTYLSHKT